MLRSTDDSALAGAGSLTARRRWSGLLVLGTAAALVWGWLADTGEDAWPGAAQLLPHASLRSDAADGARSQVVAGAGQRDLESATSASIANPFSTFQQGSARGASTTLPAPPPFAYVGKRTEAGKTVVILSYQGRNLAVSGVGMLDDHHEVEAFDERRIVLLYLPLMTRQTLSFEPSPAAATAAVAPTTPAAEPAAADSESEAGN